MAFYLFSHYGIDAEQPSRRKAYFRPVQYVNGEIKPIQDTTMEIDLALYPDTHFDPTEYYAIKANEMDKLSAIDWKVVTPEEIRQAENDRIVRGLETGQNPLSLTEEQEKHNKASLLKFEEFLKQKKKNKP